MLVLATACADACKPAPPHCWRLTCCISYLQHGDSYSLCHIFDSQQLEAWLHAAAAALQLLPLLAAWHGASWHAPEDEQPPEPGAAAALAGQLLFGLWGSGPWQAASYALPLGPQPWPGSAASQMDAQVAASLAGQAFRLHQLGCTAAQYAAANQAAVEGLLGEHFVDVDPDLWHLFLSGLGPLYSVLDSLLALSDPQETSNRWAGCSAACGAATVAAATATVHNPHNLSCIPLSSSMWLEAAAAAQWEATQVVLSLGAAVPLRDPFAGVASASAAAHWAPLVQQPGFVQLLKDSVSSQAS